MMYAIAQSDILNTQTASLPITISKSFFRKVFYIFIMKTQAHIRPKVLTIVVSLSLVLPTVFLNSSIRLMRIENGNFTNNKNMGPRESRSMSEFISNPENPPEELVDIAKP